MIAGIELKRGVIFPVNLKAAKVAGKTTQDSKAAHDKPKQWNICIY
ncbi:MAG: hypothetical protein M3162_03130 [Thermoproteota archaeon]|nr:hypothetical protein [Thermoproteota archaeon]